MSARAVGVERAIANEIATRSVARIDLAARYGPTVNVVHVVDRWADCVVARRSARSAM